MRSLALALVLLACCAGVSGSALAQIRSDEPRPEACSYNPPNWQACYDATAPASGWRALAAINLGSLAYQRGDFVAAVRFYDEGRPPRPAVLYSDVVFHAFRASAYNHVGRTADALEDANIALRMLHHDPSIPTAPEGYFPAGVLPSAIYELIIPVLTHGDHALLQTALNEYLAFPAYEWADYANRSGILEQAGEYERALAESAHALAMAPGESGVQNNHCVILSDLHRNADALTYCQAAVRINPNMAEARDSLSDVYAALGRCADAQRERAEAQRLDPSNAAYREPVTCAAAAAH